MKKFALAIMALLAFSFSVKAQQYVSTEPANRNVIIEEFTGRGCGYCPDGHRIANQIMAANPGRVWAINVHAGGYAYTTYPNFNTTASTTILGGFSVSGYPSGVVNRTTSNALDRGQWTGQANTQLNQASECNVAGVVRVNPATRVATITVEVYYTGNGAYNENYLTVAMLQDSILGSQSDYGNYNPTQWIGSDYVHMHILRDMVTPIWGEAVSPTTQGTLITKTYEYQIPEVIGNPNGVDVVLDHIFFLAWVSATPQGSATRPILTACELEMSLLTDEPIYPMMGAVSQVIAPSCDQTQTFHFSLSNIGQNELTALSFNAAAGDVTESFEWTGSLPSGDKTDVEFTMELPFGEYAGSLDIVEANGEPYEAHMAFNAVCREWATVEVVGETTSLKVMIVTDQFGEQVTWDIINSSGEVVASGGPYQHTFGVGTTAYSHTIDNIPVNDCYMFRIFDNNGNGICCNYGNGYYKVKDASNHVIIDGDGAFGSEALHLISIVDPTSVGVSETENTLKVYPNPANDYLNVEGNITSVEVLNTVGQCLLSKQVNGNTRIDLNGLSNGIYLLRVYNNGEMTVRKFSVNR